ncbi:MAG: putative sulfate exporter family transporter [Gammaproteobacteria bacterium]|nr:putative sulfate exporter family transporter [Gammaproteobacteria bacterium]
MDYLNAGWALLCGLVISLGLEHPWQAHCRKHSSLVLKASIVGLGFGLNIHVLADTAANTFLITVLSIALALICGFILMKLLCVQKETGHLISSGTAICGGSAIAAISQSIKADNEHTTVAVTVVFLLNLAGLYLFPYLGEVLNLTEFEFGLWAALAIHDTSSVVGAAAIFGDEALKVATTTKLARALWIIPLSIAYAIYARNGESKFSIPLFIVLFVLATIISYYFPAPSIYSVLYQIARVLLVIALFMMGLGISRHMLRNINMRPMLMGIILWLLLALSSLSLIKWLY